MKIRSPLSLPSIERLKELFEVSPEGLLIRRVSVNKYLPGSICGSDRGDGYLGVSVDGVALKVHRVIFAIYNGKWPDKEIDHIDGDRANNRIENLRDVDRSQNLQNRISASSVSTTGFLGVSPINAGRWKGRFKYRINVNGKRLFKGGFKTPEEAYSAYLVEKKKHHPFASAIFKDSGDKQ